MQPPTQPTAAVAKQFDALRLRGLAYPETHEDHPWGHSALKVKGKVFAFLWADAEGLSISVKLPESNSLALTLPFAAPTGYGLGKSGWVSAKFASKEKVPLELLFEWLEESFRAIAPKRVLAGMAGSSTLSKPAPKKAARKKAVSKKAASKKAAPEHAKGPTRTKQPAKRKVREEEKVSSESPRHSRAWARGGR